jgi:hypothetical protein
MPRSNGVVKSLASYKTFSDEIKDSEADIEEATYHYRRPAAHFRRCLDINVTILCNFFREISYNGEAWIPITRVDTLWFDMMEFGVLKVSTMTWTAAIAVHKPDIFTEIVLSGRTGR